MKRWLKPLVGLVVAVVFLRLAVNNMDWAAARATLRDASPTALLAAVALLAAGLAVRTLRWWRMLRELDTTLPASACVRPFLASLALNNTLPFRAGDVARTVGFRRTLRAPAARVLGTLVVERILDLATLLLFFFLGLASVPAGVIPRGLTLAALAATAGCLVALAVLVLLPQRVEALVRTMLARPALAAKPWRPKVEGAIGDLFASLGLLQRRGLAARLVLLSLLAWTLEGAVFAAVAIAIHAGVPLASAWFSMGTGTLATLIPSSPGYVGTFDYFAMLGLLAFGATRVAATTFAMLVHVVLWLPPTVAGAIALAVGAVRDGRSTAAPATSTDLPLAPQS